MKTCSKCGDTKIDSDFYRSRKFGLWARCKKCCKKESPAQLEAYQERLRQQRKDWYRQNPDLVRATQLRKYKMPDGKPMTVVDFNAMAAAQSGKCAICERQPKQLAVDHCHKKNVVRGLLCRGCNSMLGFVSEDVGALKRAVLYLESFS